MRIQATSLVLATALIAGCGSSSSSAPVDPAQEDMEEITDAEDTTGIDDPIVAEDSVIADQFTGSFSQVGSLEIFDRSFDTSVQASASFLQLSSEVSAAELAEVALEPVDECVVGLSGGSGGVIDLGLLLDLPDIEQELISAGEIIPLLSPSGSYGELAETIAFDGLSYEPQTALASPSPDTIIVDIPGGAFPAFANIELPRPVAVGGLDPAIGDTVTSAARVFTWTPTGVTGSTVLIRSRQIDFFPGGFQIVLLCRAIDDGSFSIPDSAITRLNNQFNTTSWVLELESVESEVNIIQQNGSAVVLFRRFIE